MTTYGLRELLTEAQQTQFDAMYALIVQNEMAYGREAKRRNPEAKGDKFEWFRSTDDEYLNGWQHAISTLSHTFGESLFSTVDANRAAQAAVATRPQPSKPCPTCGMAPEATTDQRWISWHDAHCSGRIDEPTAAQNGGRDG